MHSIASRFSSAPCATLCWGHEAQRWGERGYLNPAALNITLCPSSSRVSTSQHLSLWVSFSYTVPFPARRTLREVTHWLCLVGISHVMRHRLNPAHCLPQAQRRAGVTQPPLEELNSGPEPSCKALPSGVGPAPPPPAYPSGVVVRGCVGMARSWAWQDGGSGHCVQQWVWVWEGCPRIHVSQEQAHKMGVQCSAGDALSYWENTNYKVGSGG